MADLACPFFANAEAQLGYDNIPCSGSVPASEGIKRPSRNVVEFFDPPHVKGNGLGSGDAYTARGTVIFLPSTAKFSDSATMIACTLPAAIAADCTSIIDQYVDAVKRESGPQFTAVWPKITTPTTTTPPPSAADSQPGYLAYASNGVLFIQWTRVGNNVTGTLSESYSDPTNAAEVNHESDTFKGVISGSSVTLTLDDNTNWNGTLTGDGVTLSYTASDGTLHTFPFAKGTVAEYNTAVQGVTAQGNAAQQAQAQQQATTSAEQQLTADASTLSTDISTLQTASSQLTTDLGKVPTDLAQMRTDLTAQKSDLAHLLATRAATCANDNGYQVASADTYQVSSADDYQVTSADAYNVNNDFEAITTAISTLRSDAQKQASDQGTLPRYFATGLPTSSAIQAAISTATSAASVGKSKWAADLATVKQLDAISNGYASQANKACGNG